MLASHLDSHHRITPPPLGVSFHVFIHSAAAFIFLTNPCAAELATQRFHLSGESNTTSRIWAGSLLEEWDLSRIITITPQRSHCFTRFLFIRHHGESGENNETRCFISLSCLPSLATVTQKTSTAFNCPIYLLVVYKLFGKKKTDFLVGLLKKKLTLNLFFFYLARTH